MGWNRYDNYYPEYVSVGQRRANAAKQMDKLRKKGRCITPIAIEGRKITKTFWGNAWCQHIECLSDFASRLDKGRTYVRNGSVCHLEIKKGSIEAIVSGSELYNIKVGIQPLDKKRWKQIKAACAGQIASQIELLQGKFSDAVMKILTDPARGMFPTAKDFDLDCSCPDFATLCKHLAAVLYGVGARLDTQPDLLFTLRGVDPFELISQGVDAAALTRADAGVATVSADALADVFGIELETQSTLPTPEVPAVDKKKPSQTRAKPKAVAKPAPQSKPSRRKQVQPAKK